MLKASLLRSLPEIPPPVLTVYLDTNRGDSANRKLVPGYLTWLKSQADTFGANVPPAERDLYLEQVERVEAYLRMYLPKHRGLVLFAGAQVWQAVHLPVKVRSELSWGRPSLSQLFWLLDEHRPFGILAVNRKGARVYLYWLGELIQLEEKRFHADLTGWRRKDLGKFARPGIHKSRGSQRDVFEHRMTAQYKRFCHGIAQRVQFWSEEEGLDAAFLVGLEEMTRGIRDELPDAFRDRVVLVKENLAWVSRPELLRRLEPRFARWERAREVTLVDALLEGDRGVVLGIDETLVTLQRGAARSLIIESELDAGLNRCALCGWVDRVAGPGCTVCGGPRQAVSLRAVLPELAREHGTSVEVVAGAAARKLRTAGGIAAWLRRAERLAQSVAS